MITKRIIACLDVHAGRVVKGVQFVDLVDAGDPATQAARHAREGADELVQHDSQPKQRAQFGLTGEYVAARVESALARVEEPV